MPKARFTAHVNPDLLEQARDAVCHLAGPPERLTLSALVELALTKELQRLCKKHNAGQPFPPRKKPLRVGRPVR